MRVRSEVKGWSTQIYASASGPPTTLQGWGKPIGEEPDMQDRLANRTLAPHGQVLPDLDHQARVDANRLQRPDQRGRPEVLEAELPLRLMALQGVFHEQVAQLRIGDAVRLEELREDAR